MTPAKKNKNPSPIKSPLFLESYTALIKNLKERIQEARLKAATAVNENLILLYWDIGRILSKMMKEQGWGAKTIDNISKDLEASQPEMGGFSPRNLRYMRKFYESYPDAQILQQAVAKLPWGHNVLLLDKVKTDQGRLWYAE